AVEGIVAGRGHGLAAGERVEDGRGGADRGLHRRAAVLLAAGVVRGEQHVQGVGGLEQQLAADRVVVLVVVFVFATGTIAGLHVHPAVARTLGAVHAEGGVVAERVAVAGRGAERPVVAGGELGLGGLLVAGAAG